MWLGIAYNLAIAAGLWRRRAWRRDSGLRKLFILECLSWTFSAFILLYVVHQPWWNTPKWELKNIIDLAFQLGMMSLVACPEKPRFLAHWKRLMIVDSLPWLYGAYALMVFVQRTHYETGIWSSPKQVLAYIDGLAAAAAFMLATALWFGMIGHDGNRR